MIERETAQEIEDQAVRWVARLDRDGGAEDAQAALSAWLAGDDRRRGAYFRAQAAWQMVNRARILGTGQYSFAATDETDAGITDVAHEEKISVPHGRRKFWIGALAASIAVASFVGWNRMDTPAQHIETALGEIRQVPLKDGSLIAVNTDTELEVALKPRLRQIGLAKGEAWFRVAKDRNRPFIVETGDVIVRAVGTAFSVRRARHGASVQVTEGVVEVWRTGDEANKIRVTAGERTFVNERSGGSPVAAQSAAIDRSLSWRSGQIVLSGDTLAAAVAEFNRYNDIKLEIRGDALARKQMVGRFRTNEPTAFAHSTATLFGADIEEAQNKIILSQPDSKF